MATTERCKHELLVGQCAVCLGQDKKPKPRATGTTIDAQYDGRCACGCKERFAVGDSITHSTDADGWCHTDHVNHGGT